MIAVSSFGNTSVNRTQYRCPHCGQVWRTRRSLRKHVAEAHAVKRTVLTHFDRATISNRTRKLKVSLSRKRQP